MNKDKFADIPESNQFSAMARLNYDSEKYESKTVIQTLYDDRKAGQLSFLNNSLPNSWGADIKVNRHQIFTKNGFIFPAEKFISLGTIVAFTNHHQTSKFGSRVYDAEQNALNLNLIWQSSFDSPTKKHDSHSHPEEDETKSEHSESEVENSECEDEKSELPVHNYSLGFSYNYNNYLQSFDKVNYNSFESVPGGFFEYTYTGIEDLTLTSGIRADFHNLYGTLITPRIHLKYQIDTYNTLRASAGKGYHNPLPIAENQNILSSSRKLFFDEKLKSEEAWNFGINTTHELNLLGFFVTVNTEYYRTDFQNQTIVDMDQTPGEVHFYNLKGRSYSNSLQLDATIELFGGMNLTGAYRLNDVKITIDDKLQEKPLISKDKLFLNLSYSTDNDKWNFDFTTEYNGGGRIPNTTQNPTEYRMKETFPSFVLFHGQITKRFEWIEMYVGAENIGDFKQHHAIIAYDKPFGQYFDSSLIWGPIHGRKVYFGARLLFN
jgi:outer membrane cobalamin receptor